MIPRQLIWRTLKKKKIHPPRVYRNQTRHVSTGGYKCEKSLHCHIQVSCWSWFAPVIHLEPMLYALIMDNLKLDIQYGAPLYVQLIEDVLIGQTRK